MAEEQKKNTHKTVFPAQVVKVMNWNKVIINRGEIDGIKVGQRFLIYTISEEIIDPITKESLGNLEIVKGRGIVSHLQEKISTIEAEIIERDVKEITRKKVSGDKLLYRNLLGMEEFSEEETIKQQTFQKSFENPKEGDFAKPI